EATKASTPTAAPSVAGSDYVIGEGDVLGIVIWREPELSSKAAVRPDGKISLPLVNELPVVGMTTPQLQTLLIEKYKPFLTVPQVFVSVQEIHSQKVYVMGQVGREGEFPITGSSTVLQILAQAGGLKEFANKKKIYVLRTDNGKKTRIPFDYSGVI